MGPGRYLVRYVPTPEAGDRPDGPWPDRRNDDRWDDHWGDGPGEDVVERPRDIVERPRDRGRQWDAMFFLTPR